MRSRFPATALASLILFASLSNAAPLLVDSFESANMSTTNTDGFAWDVNNRTSIVTMINGAPYAVYNNGVINNLGPTGSDWTAYDGKYSLRFRYPAGQNISEQRFSLGKHYPDVWFRYWLRVPTNFSHGSQNNKFFASWTNVYDGSGDVTWQTRPTSGGSAKLVVQDGGVAVGEVDASLNFINASTDRGRWMQVAVRLKAATASGANDGIIQFYRRWSNESTFSLLYSKTNARFYEGGQGVYQGYLMGWANDPYIVDTEWLLDQFTVSTTSLIDTTTTSSPTTSYPPAAPTLQVK